MIFVEKFGFCLSSTDLTGIGTFPCLVFQLMPVKQPLVSCLVLTDGAGEEGLLLLGVVSGLVVHFKSTFGAGLVVTCTA